jgi:hypothetical protein
MTRPPWNVFLNIHIQRYGTERRFFIFLASDKKLYRDTYLPWSTLVSYRCIFLLLLHLSPNAVAEWPTAQRYILRVQAEMTSVRVRLPSCEDVGDAVSYTDRQTCLITRLHGVTPHTHTHLHTYLPRLSDDPRRINCKMADARWRLDIVQLGKVFVTLVQNLKLPPIQYGACW